MKNHEQNESIEELENDPVWGLLERTGEVDVSPFFARNVVREVRLHEEQSNRGGVIAWFSRVFKQRAAITGFAVACAVLVFGLYQIQQEKAGSFATSTVEVEQVDNEISESDRELASEIEAVEYLGQLMAVADPGELSDAALADLLFLKNVDKRALRKNCFATLRGLSDEQKMAQSAKICRLLSESPLFQSAKMLLAFIPMKSEPDLSSLTWPESGSDRTWGFPVVEANDKLTFREVDSPAKQTREGDYGIREPDPNSCPLIDLADVDMILVPGVGFDPKTGARLGRGKGHYDRFLSALLNQRRDASPPKFVGVAFSQQLRELNPEPHDVPMDCLLTDSGFAVGN